MLGAALLLFVMLFGAFCVQEAFTGRVESEWAVIGWALIVLPLLRWRVILNGLKRAGKIAVAMLVVAVLALIVNGEASLWREFF